MRVNLLYIMLQAMETRMQTKNKGNAIAARLTQRNSVQIRLTSKILTSHFRFSKGRFLYIRHGRSKTIMVLRSPVHLAHSSMDTTRPFISNLHSDSLLKEIRLLITHMQL